MQIPEHLDRHVRDAWARLPSLLQGRDVILMAGSYQADSWRFSRDEIADSFFVQLNHHMFRRSAKQPCDWLIARQGSGMIASKFLELPEQTRKRIKVLSVQANEPERYAEWSEVAEQIGAIIFPFHERGHVKANPYHYGLEWCNAFWNHIQTNPFIGILAIKMILMFPVRSLKLCGFDFFRGANGEHRQVVSCHHVERQVKWLLEVYRTDFRVVVDKSLEAVFAKYGGNYERGIGKTFEIHGD